MFYATLIVVKDSVDQYLLLKKTATDKNIARSWGLPGGKAESGEAPEETGTRELFEETGIKVLKDSLVFLAAKSTRGKETYYFMASVPVSSVLLNSEHEDYEWVGLADLFERCEFSTPQDAIDAVHKLSETRLRYERGTQGGSR
jgi:8-oxo-dGTP pyrophosphatase MutT (NUDIX family)